MEREKRPSWNEYFFGIVMAISERATCDRGRSGCVIVRDNNILTTGYVGSAPEQPHCDEVGHRFKTVIHEDGSESIHCRRTIHSELNAILQAAKIGVSVEGATLYTTMTPCFDCAMAIIRVGIKKVMCLRKYHKGEESILMFKNAGIEIFHLSDEVEKYNKQ